LSTHHAHPELIERSRAFARIIRDKALNRRFIRDRVALIAHVTGRNNSVAGDAVDGVAAKNDLGVFTRSQFHGIGRHARDAAGKDLPIEVNHHALAILQTRFQSFDNRFGCGPAGAVIISVSRAAADSEGKRARFMSSILLEVK
jgi:hypothetical protein